MPDFNVRSDSVNVEQIMEQIRARIREKRGADYTEEQIQDLARVKLETFLDPKGVRSDLLEQFRRAQPPYTPPDLPNYAFEEQTLFESHRGPLRLIRTLFRPVLKLFFNPNPLIQALNIQSRLNTMHAEREARNESARRAFDSLHYEVLHNLVVETTRLGIEVKNLKMRVESLTSRLEFNERRARALESTVAYKGVDDDPREPAARDSRLSDARANAVAPPTSVAPAPTGPSAPTAGVPPGEGPGQRSRRRRRRRGRRGGGSVATLMGGSQPEGGRPLPDQTAHAEPADNDDQHDFGEPDTNAVDSPTSAAPESTDSDSSNEEQ